MPTTNQPVTLLDLIAAAPGNRTAIVAPESQVAITYDALRQQVSSLADALAAAGIRRGDRVAMALPNGLPAIVSFLAASVAGTAAPLNPGYRREEFAFYMEDTSAKLLLLPREGGDEARLAAGDRKIPALTVESAPDGATLLSGEAKGATASAPSPEDVALVLHTSGSTGRPKRVPLKHANLAVSVQNIAATYRLGPEDVSLTVMPLFHVHGLMASVLATLFTGGTVVVPARFNPLSFWRTVKDHRATWYSAVPTMHQLLLARVGKAGEKPSGAESLRFIRSCSAPLPVEAAQRMEAVFGAPVLEAYGMTEASHQMASNPLPPSARKFGTVGPGTGVRIGTMDADGRLLATGEQGEVVIQGRNVIEGYENNPEANKNSFVDGWFRTGDQGIIDTDGYLRLVGRIKELINRGGEKVGPPEIDEVLLSHPLVSEAVCFGVPHKTLGEEVEAAVVLREPASEAALLAHCRERLAEFKCPKKIHIVTEIPRTATGKVQRRVVAAAFTGGSGMKFVIAGAGAIGAYMGARMARAGLDITLFARGPHLRAMQERGVRVRCAEGDFEARPKISDDLEAIGPADVVFLGIKAHGLADLAPRLKPLFGPETAVVSMQNGIPWWYFQNHGGALDGLRLERLDPGGVVSNAIASRRVVGSIVYLATEIAEPGVIQHVEGERISLGEPAGGRSERCRQIADALIQSGLRCRVTPHIRQEIWVKTMGNAAFNPISALTGATLAQMARDPEVNALVRSIMLETEGVVKQLGLELPVSVEQRMAGAEKVGEHKTSMLQDLEAGRPLELEAIMGAVIEIGERVGASMSSMRAVYACTKLLAQRRGLLA